VVVHGATNEDARWYYPQPDAVATGSNDDVAFWHGVEVSGDNPGEPEVTRPARH